MGKKRRRKISIFRHSASRVSVKSRWQEKRVFRSAHIEYKFHFIYSHESVIHQETAGSRGHIFIPLFIYWRNKCNNGFGKAVWCLKRNHIYDSTSFFFCHLWDSTASAGMDVSATSTAAVDVSKSFSSCRIGCWSITVMWKTCWFTRGRWPLFACVWHRRCACDRMRMCVSCVFIFWRFQRQLPKVKRGGFILSWKNLNRSKT